MTPTLNLCFHRTPVMWTLALRWTTSHAKEVPNFCTATATCLEVMSLANARLDWLKVTTHRTSERNMTRSTQIPLESARALFEFYWCSSLVERAEWLTGCFVRPSANRALHVDWFSNQHQESGPRLAREKWYFLVWKIRLGVLSIY
jgi:hypothetical protein